MAERRLDSDNDHRRDTRGLVARHDGADPGARPGWSRPKPEHVPRPTYWPAVLALGVTFLGWGLIATPLISAVGLALIALGLACWIGELRHGA